MSLLLVCWDSAGGQDILKHDPIAVLKTGGAVFGNAPSTRFCSLECAMNGDGCVALFVTLVTVNKAIWEVRSGVREGAARRI
jgi:hypothetical protein